MKKLIPIIFILLLAWPANAQVTKTIDISIPGTLRFLLTYAEKAIVTNLTVTGNLDTRDIECMRDEITNLAVLDISNVRFKTYKGIDGTYASVSGFETIYPANEFPIYSFYEVNIILRFFKSKTSLKTIILPTLINWIGDFAFYGCTGLTQITIPDNVISIGSSTFSGCTNLNSIIIPDGVNSIGSSAFSGCTSLTTLTLGKLVNSIESMAFYGCTQLTTIYSANYFPPVLGSGSFMGIPKANVYVSATGYPIYKTTTGWKNMNLIMVPDNTTIQVNISGNGMVTENNTALSNNSQVSVTFPDTKTFTLVPDAGYEIATVKYNGTDVKSQVTGNTFTSPPVVNNTDVLDVSFIKSTGTPELTDNRVKVYAAQSVIHVEGTTAGEPISLYTIQGQQLQAIKSQGERTMLHVKQAGIYLVKVGSKTFKVVL